MILLLVGAFNWGFIGFFNYNFIAALFGGTVTGDYLIIERIVYALVGLAGIWGIKFLFMCFKKCCKSKEGEGNNSCCSKDDKHDS